MSFWTSSQIAEGIRFLIDRDILSHLNDILSHLNTVRQPPPMELLPTSRTQYMAMLEQDLNTYFKAHLGFLTIERLEILINADTSRLSINAIIDTKTWNSGSTDVLNHPDCSGQMIPDDSELELILKQLSVERVINS
jgi:hypothetical protein